MTRNRDGWDTVIGVMSLLGLVLVGVGLGVYLVAHPVIAALWALAATAGTGWFGALYAARSYDARTLARAEERRRAVPPAPEPETVAELLRSCRTGRRIGDAERDVFVGALHTHFAAGRLDVDEHAERLAAVLAARTVEDLAVTVDGLPSEVTGR
jgi:hypothetical protein